MRTKTILLHSVSAIATAAAAAGAAGQAQAQVLATGDDGYTFSVQGGLLFSPAEQTLVGMDKMGSGIFGSGDPTSGIFGSGDSSIGYNAAFSVGKQIDENWDVRFGGSINKLLENTVGFTASSGSSYYSALPGGGFDSGFFEVSESITGHADFSFETLDFEVGYTPVLADDNMSVRLFAGIRGLHFSSTGGTQFGANFSSGRSASAGYGSGSFSSLETAWFEVHSNFKTEFFGVGPRIGVSAAHRFEGTNWGLSGTLAGAALFGRQTTSFSQGFSSGFFSGYSASSGGSGSAPAGSSISSGSSFEGPTSSETTDKMVFDVQAKAGVDFYLDDKTALTFGYQAEQIFGVGSSGNAESNKLVHGPFISLSGAL